MSSRQHRIVITGMGAVTNLGHNAGDTWVGMREGRSGITSIEGQDFAIHAGKWDTTFGGQVKNWDPAKYMDFREARRIDSHRLKSDRT